MISFASCGDDGQLTILPDKPDFDLGKYWSHLKRLTKASELRRAKAKTELAVPICPPDVQVISEERVSVRPLRNAVSLTALFALAAPASSDPATMSEEELAAFNESANDSQLIQDTVWQVVREGISGRYLWHTHLPVGQHIAHCGLPVSGESKPWTMPAPINHHSSPDTNVYWARLGRLERDKGEAISMTIEALASWIRDTASAVVEASILTCE